MLKAGPDMLSGQKKRRNGKVDFVLSNFGEKVFFVHKKSHRRMREFSAVFGENFRKFFFESIVCFDR